MYKHNGFLVAYRILSRENINFMVFFLQGKWLPTLRNLVAKINETFSFNFQEMAVAGEVSLGLLDGN